MLLSIVVDAHLAHLAVESGTLKNINQTNDDWQWKVVQRKTSKTLKMMIDLRESATVFVRFFPFATEPREVVSLYRTEAIQS
jgi:hypothetical protein